MCCLVLHRTAACGDLFLHTVKNIFRNDRLMSPLDTYPLAGVLADTLLIFVGDICFPVMDRIFDVGFILQNAFDLGYEMQTDPDDWSQPGLLGLHITVEHFGTVLTASPLPLPSGGYLDLAPGDFVQGQGAERLTAAEFEAKYLDPDYQPPPAVRPEQRWHSRTRVVQPVR